MLRGGPVAEQRGVKLLVQLPLRGAHLGLWLLLSGDHLLRPGVRSAEARPRSSPAARERQLRYERQRCTRRLLETDFSKDRFSTAWASHENMTAFVDCLHRLRTTHRSVEKVVHAGGVHYPTLVVANHRDPVVSTSGAAWCWRDKYGTSSGMSPRDCCSTDHGPRGLEACWDGHFSYELCCKGHLAQGELPHFYSVPAMDLNVGNIVKRQGTFDLRMSYALQALCRPGFTVLDVGANLGGFTVPLAERVGPTGRVHAFEPFRTIFQHMTANVALNGLTNVYTYNYAIGREDTTLELHEPDLHSFGAPSAMRVEGQFSPEEAATYDKVIYEPARVKVEMRRLDSFNFGTKVDFIKIDVEFMELEVVMGARSLIARDRPVIWAENEPYFKNKPPDTRFVEAMDRELGYTCQPVADLELLCTPPEATLVAVETMQRIMALLNVGIPHMSLQHILTAAQEGFPEDLAAP